MALYTDTTWGAWNFTTSSTSSTTYSPNEHVWDTWVTSSVTTTNTVSGYDWAAWNEPVQLSQEERAARLAAEAERRAAAEKKRLEAEAERKIVRERAKRILMENLDAEQKRQLEKDKFFYVFSEDRQRRYRIKQGKSMNVELVNEEGRVIHRYCAYPREGVPDEDAMLAQKLFLEGGLEQDFLRVANVS